MEALARKYDAINTYILRFNTMRIELLVWMRFVDGRFVPVAGFYWVHVDPTLRSRITRKAAARYENDPLFQVVLSDYPVEALAHWIIRQEQLTMHEVKQLLELNQALRRYYTKAYWVPAAIGGALFFALSSLSHELIIRALGEYGVWYDRSLLLASVGVAIAGLVVLVMLFPITTLGAASRTFDNIEALLSISRLILDHEDDSRGLKVPELAPRS